MGKIESYIGFAIKSGKIIYGIDTVKGYRKRMYLLLMCPTASENLKGEAERFSQSRSLQLITTTQTLEQLTNKTNCKLVAILDSNLAKAIADNIRR